MTEETDPFLLLASDSAVDRQRGARALTGRVVAGDIARIRDLRMREVDSFVQQALDKLILQTEDPTSHFGDSDGWMQLPAAQFTDDIRAEAIQYVTKVMLHELRPLVGETFRSARDGLGDEFRGSATHDAIARLKDFLDTMHRLHAAAAPPAIVQFDLSAMLRDEIDAAGSAARDVLLSRSDAVTVLGDPALLRLAFQNCLRNAIEACAAKKSAVVVNCGTNQLENWVAILDEGVGLPDGGDQILEPGNSTKTKDEHFGMGLPIAQRAMQSFGGSVELTRRKHGGTACHLRWVAQLESS